MSEIVKKRKERLHYPPDLKAVYESSGLGCTYEEWLEDAVRELNLTAKTRWEAIQQLEQEVARLREALNYVSEINDDAACYVAEAMREAALSKEVGDGRLQG